MFSSIFTNTLRRSWKTALWWGLGIGSLVWLQVIVLQDVTAIQQTAQLLESIPPLLLQAIGGTSDLSFMATPDGYMAVQFFGFAVLIYAIYAVLAGLNITANDEEAGIMDSVLSLPVVRWQLVLARFIAYVLLSIFVVAISALCLALGFAMTPNVNYTVSRMMLGMVNMLPSMILILAFTTLVAAIARRRMTAIIIAAVFLVASYMFNVFALAAPGTVLDAANRLSFMSYYDAVGVIQNGLSPLNIGVLLAAALLCVVIAMWRYEERDIGL